MKNGILRGLLTVSALAGSALVWATSPSSANYALPASAINSGVGDMASAGYKLSSSLGDAFQTGLMSSAGYRLNPGFWGAVTGGVPTCLLDVDGNTFNDTATDGLMLLRAMFRLTGPAVVSGAIGNGAAFSDWTGIGPRIHLSALDLDGNGATDALTDGVLLLRAMMGRTGAAVTAGAVGSGASRLAWEDIRVYLNANCGTSYLP
jgi:hypothetical protein